jgi:hypothetical protein
MASSIYENPGKHPGLLIRKRTLARRAKKPATAPAETEVVDLASDDDDEVSRSPEGGH